MDIAKELLANVEAEPAQKALAQHAFEVAPHERVLKGMLDRINIPLQAKADLWDAKKNASLLNPKLHKLLDIANLPQDLLDKAEQHPNVLKALLTEDKPSESKSGAKGSEKAPKAQEQPNKEASKESEAESTQNGQEAGMMNQLPPLNPGFFHFRDPSGAEHYAPLSSLDKIKQVDPNIEVLKEMPMPSNFEHLGAVQVMPSTNVQQMQQPMQESPQTGEEQPA